jgi:topoisomerase-4 subunit A
MPAITRDKEYNLDMGNPNSKVHYLSANPNGEAEVVEVKLTPASSARKKIFDFDFSELEVKGRGVRGNMITKYPVRKVDFKESRGSTLSGLDLWFDEASGRLNKDKRGKYVGKFDGDDQIIAITKSGAYKITSYELSNRYEPEKTILVQKYNPKKVVTAVYLDGESKQYFVKRFLIETNTLDKEFGFISEGIGSRLDYASTSDSPEIEMDLVKGKGKEKETEVVSLEEIVDVKGWKALGNRLSQYKVTKIKSLEDPDETGFEEGDSDNDVATVETSKSSQPSKKKFPYATAPGNRWEEPEEGEQASLFEESQSQANQSQPLVNGQPPKPKEKKPTAEQANLFEENQNQKKEVKKDDDEKGYTPGQTVELDF